MPKSPDPVEIALADAGRGGAGGEAAATFLEKHGRLVEAQLVELRLRNFGERMRAALWGLAAAGGLLLAALLLVAVWNASRANALIVEPLQVPRTLEQRGISGRVLAAQLIDRMGAIEGASGSVRATNSFANNWDDDIQIAIPQTGISFGEAWRVLRGWLGQETRISGEVIETPAGVSVTVRIGGLPGQTFSGGGGELDRLLQSAAEAIYRDTQSSRYAAYLLRAGRLQEAEQIARQVGRGADQAGRKWAFNTLGVVLKEAGQPLRAMEALEQSIRIDPNMVLALGNLGNIQWELGDPERALATLQRQERAWSAVPTGEYDPVMGIGLRARNQARIGFILRDPVRLLDAAERIGNDPSPTQPTSVDRVRAAAMRLRHEPGAMLRVWRDAPPSVRPAAAALLAMFRSQDQLLAAMEFGSVEQVRAVLPRYLQAAQGWRTADRSIAGTPIADVQTLPAAALALARTGAHSDAEATIARAPARCYECVRAGALVAIARGDHAAAEERFAEAVRLGPSLPAAWLDWGRARLAAGDTAGAIERLRAANQRSPNWADPLKYWADALSRQGNAREALRRYAQAAERAPRWGALHINWGISLWRTGRQDEARQRFSAAAGMDLSRADRARLQRIWTAASRQR